jgi:hypothetical protein
MSGGKIKKQQQKRKREKSPKSEVSDELIKSNFLFSFMKSLKDKPKSAKKKKATKSPPSTAPVAAAAAYDNQAGPSRLSRPTPVKPSPSATTPKTSTKPLNSIEWTPKSSLGVKRKNDKEDVVVRKKPKTEAAATPKTPTTTKMPKSKTPKSAGAATPRTIQKKEGNDPELFYGPCTVQTTLKKAANKFHFRSFKKLIIDDVDAVSEQSALFSKYFNWLCHKERHNPDFFAQLAAKGKNGIRDLHTNFRSSGGDVEFKKICDDAGIIMNKKNFKNRSALLANDTMQYATTVITNLTTHLKSRLTTYYKKYVRLGHAAATAKVTALMENSNGKNEWEVDFAEGHPFIWIPALMTMSEAIREEIETRRKSGMKTKNCRSFKVIPEVKERRRHILYDNQAMMQLTNQRIEKENAKRKQQRQQRLEKFNQRETMTATAVKKNHLIATKKQQNDVIETRRMFAKLFNFEQFERPKYSGSSVKTVKDLATLTKKFNCSFTTNGLVACLHFSRVIGKKMTKKIGKKTITFPEPPPPTPLNHFRYFMGVDPGFRYFVGAVCVDRTTGEHNNQLLLSNDWHKETRHFERLNKFDKMHNEVEKEMREEREHLNMISQSSKNFRSYTQF